MAYTEMYIQTTGSNTNSGTTNSDTALATSTNGDWSNAVANRFTAASGTPFSAVQVGDWASIYNDGDTTVAYIAQVTAVNSGGASIDLSATNKIGTATASGATGKSCSVGGAWASFQNFTSIGTQTVAVSTRINVKAGTYANTTSSRTMAISGTTTTPLWIRGYNSTIGDLDDDFTTTKPLVTFTTGALTISGAHVFLSNIWVTSAITSGNACTWSGTTGKMDRCKIENTAANTTAIGLSVSGAVFIGTSCWFKATSTATNAHASSATAVFHGCQFEGGGIGLAATNAITCTGCYFKGHSNHGINFNASAFSCSVAYSTFDRITNDGIHIVATPAHSWIHSNIFSGCGGYNINNATGTNTNLVYRSNNTSYNVGLGTSNGFGDSNSVHQKTDSSSSTTSSSDPTPVSGSNARLTALPTKFEGQTFTSYRDAGCIQHQDTGGSPATRGIVVGG